MTDPTSIPTTPLDRNQVLEATAYCFERHGFEGTTIRRIASHLNCAVGSIYRYFTDKQELLTAMSERQLADVAVKIDSGGSFDESMRLYVARARAAPRMYRLMFWLACVGEHDSPPNGADEHAEVDSTADPAVPGFPAVISTIIAGWSRRLGDAQLARDCWAMLHGSLLLGRSGDQIVVLLLKLVGPRAEIQTPLIASRSGSPVRATPHHPGPVVIETRGLNTPHGRVTGAIAPSPSPEDGDTTSEEDVCLL